MPLLNVINGGAHADNPLDLQEFMLVPYGAGHLRESLQLGVEVFHALKKLLHERGLATAVGDEGGFAPDIATADEAIELILEAIEAAGHTPGEDVGIALDPATSELFRDGRYHLTGEGKVLDSAGWPSSGTTSARATRSSRSRTAWPRTTGTAGSC